MSSSISGSERRPRRPKRGLARWSAAGLAGLAGAAALWAAAVAALVDETTILVYVRDMLAWKLARLEAPGRPPQLIVVSGSNALFSVDSPTLARIVGRPVTNVAAHWGIAYYAAERVAERLVPGDAVLAPLEYEYYSLGETLSSTEACYLIAHDRGRIRGLAGWRQVLTRCSPTLLAGGVAIKLMGLVGLAYPRADMREILTEEGDRRGNERARARWRGRLDSPKIADTGAAPLRYPRLERIVAAWRAKGALVLLSFPVLPEGAAPVSAAWLAKFRAWAARHGARVVSRPEAHQFPPDCFFDSSYHLHDGCTAENSRRYARAVAPHLK